jgi:hypothetical protein
MKSDLYAEVSARIVAVLEAGAAPWVKPWSATPGANTSCNAVSNRPYSGRNVVLLWMAQAASYPARSVFFLRHAARCDAIGLLPELSDPLRCGRVIDWKITLGDCMGSKQPLAVSGLLMPPDFPSAAFEATYRGAAELRGPYLDDFVGAWNAVSYRYRALLDYSDSFEASIRKNGAAPEAGIRYIQEKDLFGFFSSAFSIFEAFFFGMFAVGATLSPVTFPFATPADRQRVGVSSTIASYKRAWESDPIIATFEAMSQDPLYRGLRDARNVLTHRVAPGRKIYVSLSEDELPTGDWKLFNSTLDERTTRTRRDGVSRLLEVLTNASQLFVEAMGKAP